MFGFNDSQELLVSTKDFDVIVLGAGPAGEVCAGRLADNDLAVALEIGRASCRERVCWIV